MADIPLVALSANTQQPSPLDQYAKILGLKNAQQEMQQRAALAPGQQQLQQAQITGAGQQNQIGAADVQLKNIQVKDQQLLSQLYPQFTQKTPVGEGGTTATTGPTGYDFDGLKQAYIKGGGSLQGLSQINGIQANNADLTTKLAGAGEAQIKQAQAQNSALNDGIESLQAIPDPQARMQALPEILANLQKMGVDTLKLSQQPPTDDNLAKAQAGLGMHQQVVNDAQKLADSVRAQQEADPVNKLSTPEALASPGAKAAIQQKIDDPATKPQDVPRLQALLPKADTALKATLAVDQAKKQADQAIQDGDPNAAAKLLVSGNVAPQQLISSRKPEFAQKAFTAAENMQPGWNAQRADADFKVASSPAQVSFFGSAKSLTDPGGTLDQLKAAGKDIPQGQIPIFNTVADALKASTGSGPVAKYAAIALGVADDYAKVMGGGTGSDTARTQALNIISAKQSPEQRDASLEGIRGSVGSQTRSRIGNNAVLQRMYGAAQGGGPTASQAAPQKPSGATHIGIGSDDKKKHYLDASGKDLGLAE